MSKAEILRFAADLQSDPALRKEVQAKGGGVAEIVEIAKARAYAITLEEARAYVATQTKGLTEEQLDKVAAGRGTWVSVPPPPKVIVP